MQKCLCVSLYRQNGSLHAAARLQIILIIGIITVFIALIKCAWNFAKQFNIKTWTKMKSLNFFANTVGEFHRLKWYILSRFEVAWFSKRILRWYSPVNFLNLHLQRISHPADFDLVTKLENHYSHMWISTAVMFNLWRESWGFLQGVTAFPRVLKVPKGVLIFNLYVIR